MRAFIRSLLVCKRYFRKSVDGLRSSFSAFKKFNPESIRQIPNREVFSFSKKEDIYFIDQYSDATAFGGLSQAKYKLNNGVLSVQGTLRKDYEGLVVLDDLFAGISSKVLTNI